MKNIFTIILLAAFTGGNAQVIIGDAAGTASTKTSVLLEFAAGNKGLILPYVRTLPAATDLTKGTLLLDASTATAARVKFSDGSNWIDLSGQDADVTAALVNQPTGITETTSKAIIGASTSDADGVLVLESTTKAMVLPIVSDVQNIPNPSPGMLVYVNTAGRKRLAVYNGSKWSFWREPNNTVPVVTSPTGRIWMDRNLGATQVATSSTDAAAFGDLYQWGRGEDGHQLRTSGTTLTLSSTDTPGNANFITSSADWRSPKNDNLWQGVNGINNPCPSGFRLPTQAELAAEVALFSTQDTVGAFASILKIPAAAFRSGSNGSVLGAGSQTYFWTSNFAGNNATYFYIVSNIGSANINRSYGFSVRCIQN